MKILLITHYYPEHLSGVEIVADKIAKYLNLNHKAEIVWVSSEINPSKDRFKEITYIPVKVNNIFEDSIGIPYPLWGIASVIKIWNSSKNIDVIHIHDFIYPGSIIAFIISKIKKKPLVITQHIGLIPFKNIFLKMLHSLLNNTLGRFMLSKADYVVFYSKNQKSYFSKIVKFKNPPLWIEHGVDSSIFKPISKEERLKCRENLKISCEKKVFLFIGRFVEKKGLGIIKRLAEKFKDIEWVIIGWGIINPLSWNLKNVKVVGKVPYNDLVKYYQCTDLLILPSKGEGFPLVVQESMACGTPALISTETMNACPEIKDYVFFKDVNNINDWSEIIEDLSKNPDLLESRRSKVSTFAKNKWSWDECSNKYYEAFKKCLPSK